MFGCGGIVLAEEDFRAHAVSDGSGFMRPVQSLKLGEVLDGKPEGNVAACCGRGVLGKGGKTHCPRLVQNQKDRAAWLPMRFVKGIKHLVGEGFENQADKGRFG